MSEGLKDRDTSQASQALRDQIIALLPRLRRFCMALTGTADAGDDLTQSTLERVFERIEQWRPGSRLDSWMYRIAQNINIDQARARKTRGVQIDSEALDDMAGDDGRQVVEGRSSLARARQAMANLPEDQRALMALVVIEGQSYKVAAETLGIPIGTVMSRLARARRSISDFVRGPDDTETPS